MLLAFAAATCDGNQMQLNECWTSHANAAFDTMESSYKRISAQLKKLGLSTDPLAASQDAWLDVRTKTCAFEASLYEGGSIQPMEEAMCYYRFATARARQLDAVTATLRDGGSVATLAAVSTNADAELNRVYGLYLKQELTPSQKHALVNSELAWIAYRDSACKVEGGSCLTILTKERTAELKAGWIGEAFW